VPTELPTTSYAVLGMLSLRSWTGYELTQQMRRSLDYCWPKTESVLYDEPRRLVSLGLARAKSEKSGGRVRQRYEITAAGRRALRKWLRSEPQDPRLELEVMLRLLFADQGDAEDLRRSIAAFRRWSKARHDAGMAMFREYLDGASPFQERAHINVLFGAFFAGLFELVEEWSATVEAELDAWPNTNDLGMTETGRRLATAALERQAAAAESGSDPPLVARAGRH
jgi:PadR family transcriptional regulator, regulatory protein AphA